MALISATTILTSICLFHMTLAYFFFVNPAAIADQALVWILGETLRIPETQTITHPTPTTSLLAIFLFLQGLSDLTILSLTTRGTLTPYWTTQIPTRMTLFGALGVLAYMAKPPSTRSSTHYYNPNYAYYGNDYGNNNYDPNYPSSAKNNYGKEKGENGLTVLHTRLFLTLALIEVLAWFWAWVTLGEEATTPPSSSTTPTSPPPSSTTPSSPPTPTSNPTSPTSTTPSSPTTPTTAAMKKKWMEEKEKWMEEKWIEDAERKKRRRARTEGSNSVDDEEGEEERRGRTRVREWERR